MRQMLIVFADEKDGSSARSLAGCWQGSPISVEIKQLDDPDYTVASAEQVITLVAHTDNHRKKIGNKTPKELVNSFKRMHPTPELRANLKDLNLISCEAGFPLDNKNPPTTLAQQLAVELFKQGFTNVHVHAIAPPVDEPMAEMRVEVVERSGVLNNTVPGEVIAYGFREPVTDLDEQIEKNKAAIASLNTAIRDFQPAQGKPTRGELATTRSTLSQANTDLEKAKNALKIPFVSAANYEDYINVMHQPGNTFADPRCNTKIMDSVPVPQKTVVQVAIEFLRLKLSETQSSDMKQKDKEKRINYINADLEILRRNPGMDAASIKETLWADKHPPQRLPLNPRGSIPKLIERSMLFSVNLL